MPTSDDTNRPTLSSTEAQEALGPLVADLRAWDQRLDDWIDQIEPGDETADDLILTSRAVRREQIAEALAILAALETVGAEEPLPPFHRQMAAAERPDYDARAAIIFSDRGLPVCCYCRRATPERPGPIGYRMGHGPVCDPCFSARHPELAILITGIMALRRAGRAGVGRWLVIAIELLMLGRYLEHYLADVWPARPIEDVRLPAPQAR